MIYKCFYLKYVTTSIVFREVPNEVSLGISISNCPNKCKGCHSAYLREDIGDTLNKEELNKLIDLYKGVTCICFLGGDGDIDTLLTLSKLVKDRGLKVAWYSGCESINSKVTDNLNLFDYIKIGPYIEDLGGLDSKTTNQVFYEVKLDKDKYILENKTNIFNGTKNQN